MKRLCLLAFASLWLGAQAQKPQDTSVSQMEKLDRGLIAFPTTSNNCFVSWRLLGTDNQHTTFELLKNGKSLKKNIYQNTALSVPGKKDDVFQVVTVQDGVEVDTTAEVKPWSTAYLALKLNRPEKLNNKAYFPNDMSVGDVDGDGQYELFVKWDPENSKDNSNTGASNPVIIDCYKLDGTQLWRVKLAYDLRETLDALAFLHALLVFCAFFGEIVVGVEQIDRHGVSFLCQHARYGEGVAAVVARSGKYDDRSEGGPCVCDGQCDGLGRALHQVDGADRLMLDGILVEFVNLCTCKNFHNLFDFFIAKVRIIG